MIDQIPTHTHTLVIGAGVTGLSIAYHLARYKSEDVLVLDQFDLLGFGSSGRSAGGFRQQFSQLDNISLAMGSKSFFEHFEENFGINLSLKKNGYLLLAQSGEELESLHKDCHLQQSLKLPVEHLGPDKLASRFPYLNRSDLLGANLCLEDGYLDPHSLLQGYLNAILEAGYKVLFGVKVRQIKQHQKNGTFIVNTSQGSLMCTQIINAAGAWSSQIAAMIGETLPVKVRKRQIFVSDSFPLIGETPLIIQMHQPFYFRKEGDVFLLSIAETDPLTKESYEDPPVNWSSTAILAERAIQRVPLFENLSLVRAWAGLRTLTADDKPILCRSLINPFVFHACGLSGHGISFSPSVGRLMAGLIHNQAPLVKQLRPFRLDRFSKKD
ncbi:NAD(P)/FAD-dependent oxidoreductase [candidate division CSSED10-310 bacterium]|uniref:NAD(P)/FAD-dependent oxidoreductase n=1 Tax=candidate division CSSED10-310 bacterium TaxID=2855610 RepID=A0ABV6Z0F5_UNCC1